MKLNRRQAIGACAGALLAQGVFNNTTNVWGQAPAQSLALCVGLGSVDPSSRFYKGWSGQLNGTIPDATFYEQQFKTNRTFSKVLRLHNADAHADNLYRHILWAAKKLNETKNGLFVLTYAGHGMQVPDQDGDEQDDSKDEAMCLWDRPLIDDELRFMWQYFNPDVRVVLITDSCHSGSQSRAIESLAGLDDSIAKSIIEAGPLSGSRSVPLNIDGQLNALKQGEAQSQARSRDVATPDIDDLIAQAEQASQSGMRAMEQPLADALMRAGGSEIVGNARANLGVTTAPNDGKGTVRASVISISGCKDQQVSMETGGHGVFTQVFANLWKNGQFNGTYADFVARMQAAMPQSQQPVLDAVQDRIGFSRSQQLLQI